MENDAGRDAEIVLRFSVRCGFREAPQKIFNLRGTARGPERRTALTLADRISAAVRRRASIGELVPGKRGNRTSGFLSRYGGLFSFHDAEIITALAKLTGDTFLAELALPIVELGSGDYPSS
jgi:hypothetical protein